MGIEPMSEAWESCPVNHERDWRAGAITGLHFFKKKRHDYTTTRTSNRWVGVLDPLIPFKQTIRELHRSGWKANVEG